MSIRHGLLALLAGGPRYGSRLRTEFEARTGGTWPLNIGQVYTTLGRLERDGLVVRDGVDEAGRVLYALTAAGRAELRAWYARPVQRASPPRDELAIKLVMAVGAEGVDVREVVEAQRRHVAQALHDHVRQRAEALARAPQRPDEVARLLVLEQLVFQAEAEARWLDHCQARLLRLPHDLRLAEDAAPDPGGGHEPPRRAPDAPRDERPSNPSPGGNVLSLRVDQPPPGAPLR